jgi:hypothetical protein
MLCALTVRKLYERRRAAIDELVESVGADGIFEVVEKRSME